MSPDIFPFWNCLRRILMLYSNIVFYLSNNDKDRATISASLEIDGERGKKTFVMTAKLKVAAAVKAKTTSVKASNLLYSLLAESVHKHNSRASRDLHKITLLYMQ